MDIAAAFEPLHGSPPPRATRPDDDTFVPSAAPDSSEPPTSSNRLGSYSYRWPYMGADGVLQGFQCRFETEEGKEFRPLRYGSRRGRTGWHWKGWADGRPLYRLPDLAARQEATILVVEGEKAADAAAAVMLHMVVVSPMNGAQSPHRTDWRCCAGRSIVVRPDADEAGRDFARKVAMLAMDAGANEVRIVAVPDGAPEGWDLADEMPADWTAETIETALAAAPQFDPDGEIQGAFRICYRYRKAEAPGLYHLIEKEDKETGDITREWVWFASRIDVLADTRNGDGEAWGRLLGIHDRDGTVHQWAMPMAMMAGAGEDYRRELLHRGLVLSFHRQARSWLAD